MMSGELLRIDQNRPEPDTIKLAADLIRSNKVVVAPTETRYGMLVRADLQKTVQHIYKIKRRDLSLPTAIFVSSTNQIGDYLELTQEVNQLTTKFLPGPLTLVGKAVCDLPAPVVISGRIGVRVSSSPLIAALTAETGLPITATSANLSSYPEPVTCGEILDVFGDLVDLYLDAGQLEGAVSTVVDLSSTPIQILREGAISRLLILDAVGGGK
jgi:L-threonylcarbamoyladenylate synthase